MGDLGVVPTWIPLLLSAPSGTSVQSERAETGDCNLSEDHPGSETGCKRTTETGRTLQQHPLSDQWGNLIWGGCTSFGDASYASLLDTTGTGGMGSMDIPKIGVELPIYHGTSEEVLSKGIGHLQGSSLPVGGESTHSILTGHRGLPQSKLLTRLDELEEGDYFFFHVLDETLAYQVTEIQVVKPEEVSVLKIQEGQDLASIITCTPYGLNTHRLIVTGKRVPYEAKQANSMGEELPSARELVFTLLPFAFLLLFLLYIWRERRRTINEAKDDDKI